MRYFDPLAPRSGGRYYDTHMPFSDFIYPTNTEEEKDELVQKSPNSIVPLRDYYNGEVYNLGPTRDLDLPSLKKNMGDAPMAESYERSRMIGIPALVVGAAALLFFFLKKE